VLRAGMHVGRPERMGDDYFGVDVNIAARVAEAASGNEILATGKVLEDLDPDSVKARRKRMFRAKGVPTEIKVYLIRSSWASPWPGLRPSSDPRPRPACSTGHLRSERTGRCNRRESPCP